MKNLKWILLVTLLAGFQAGAQTYKIDTSQVSYENKLRPCLQVKYDASAKTVKKAWDHFFDKNYNVKIKGIGLLANKDVITGTDIILPAISDKRMNLYAMITDEGGGSAMHYFMSFGYDFFIGPDNYATEFAAMKKILNDFSIEFLNDYYASEAGSIIGKIKDLEKDIRKNDKDIKKNNRKAGKSSAAVANGLSAKNTSMVMENEEKRRKIIELNTEIESIKVKQKGITRN